MWVPAFVCPACHAPPTQHGHDYACPRCGASFRSDASVYRFMLPEHAESSRPFVSQYRAVRRADGHIATAAAAYATLPLVPRGSPDAAEWRIRRLSFDTAVSRGGLRTNHPRRILDV